MRTLHATGDVHFFRRFSGKTLLFADMFERLDCIKCFGGDEWMAALAALTLAALILRFPDLAIKSAREALFVWGRDIVPSLFPYMVLCKTLSSRLKKSRIPSVPLVLTLGLLGGSPSGAAMISAASDTMSRRQCVFLSALTGTISPMFFLSTLRTWGFSQSLCIRLLSAHWIGACFAAFCAWRFESSYKIGSNPTVRKDLQMASPIADSVQAVLGVGGCIVFFSVVASCISCVFSFPSEWSRASFQAMLEIAGGIHALSLTDTITFQTAVCMAGLMGFGGISILTQNHLFLKSCGIAKKQLFVFAFLRAVGSTFSMALLLQFM